MAQLIHPFYKLLVIHSILSSRSVTKIILKYQAMHFSASTKYKNLALNSNDPDVDISKHKHIMFKDKK